MSGRIFGHTAEGIDRFLRRREGEEAFAGREMFGEARVLGDDGAPAREVVRAAFAEPAGPRADVAGLRDRELA